MISRSICSGLSSLSHRLIRPVFTLTDIYRFLRLSSDHHSLINGQNRLHVEKLTSTLLKD